VEVPTTYDGPDLEEVARVWGMSTAEVVATHTGLEHEVAFCGFSPGFAYCAGLPEHLAVPRRHDPRPRVPAGSVAVADRWTGVYPTASPGGWQLLGRTDLVLWDADREPPATLAPGTRVRFVVA
jgi:KipI family sensor histidine kinase inhibitor